MLLCFHLLIMPMRRADSVRHGVGSSGIDGVMNWCGGCSVEVYVDVVYLAGPVTELWGMGLVSICTHAVSPATPNT